MQPSQQAEWVLLPGFTVCISSALAVPRSALPEHPAKLGSREIPAGNLQWALRALVGRLLGAALSPLGAPGAPHWLCWDRVPYWGTSVMAVTELLLALAACLEFLNILLLVEKEQSPSSSCFWFLSGEGGKWRGKKWDFGHCVQGQCSITELGWWHCQAAAGPALSPQASRDGLWP